ncbi:MAG: argininosuccinate lyase [Oscillospiraceae bacterium]|nr:argininosuccinate lyase [Oscillospiraceae bacterium]
MDSGLLRAGRFAAPLDGGASDFNSSLPFDKRLFAFDVRGGIAHAQMLAERGIITKEDGKAITEALAAMLAEEPPISGAEDIHSFVEAELTRRIGEAGRRLHTARSRNDQVALDFRLYALDSCEKLTAALAAFLQKLVTLAREHLRTVMPGYTHLQRAQPVTLAHHLAAWCQMLRRDITRIADARARMDECPLGCGALAGTTFPIDRHMTARALGFAGVCPNSLDGVADRDFAAELLAALALIMAHLSRMAEEVILWTSSEFAFAALDDAHSTGSSMMPQKKNPDIAELVRGKTGRVYGSLFALLTVVKGLPLAYNKDLQEDKEALFSAVDTTLLCLDAFAAMVVSLVFSKENMLRAAKMGFLNATDCADYLARRGLPFRDSHAVAGALVRFCLEGGMALEDLTLEQLRGFSPLFDEDVYAALDLHECVNGRASYGGPAPAAVTEHLDSLAAFIARLRGEGERV